MDKTETTYEEREGMKAQHLDIQLSLKYGSREKAFKSPVILMELKEGESEHS